MENENINLAPIIPTEERTNEQSFFEKLNIHPAIFLFFSVGFLFFSFVFGSILVSLLLYGALSPDTKNADAMRLVNTISQIMFLLVPAILLAKLYKKKLNDVFNFRMPSISEFVTSIVGLFALQRILETYLFFQENFLMPESIKNLFAPLNEYATQIMKTIVSANSPTELLYVIFVIAIVPAIVEEICFRGLIQKTVESFATQVIAVVSTGIIFGLFHLNIINLVPIICLGIFLGFLKIRSNSLIIPMLLHFLNNLMSVLLVYFGMDTVEFSKTTYTQQDILLEAIKLCVFSLLFFISMRTYLHVTKTVNYD